MHQLALLLLIHLFALHLTSYRCWAQESTPTTTTATIETSVPSFNDNINNNTNQDSNTATTSTSTATSTATMSANPDSTAPFQLSAPSTVYQCEDTFISWSGGNTVPLYEVYYAEGSGETGDESALRAEKWLGAISGNNFTWAMDASWNSEYSLLLWGCIPSSMIVLSVY
jgi:hypothetical protein